MMFSSSTWNKNNEFIMLYSIPLIVNLEIDWILMVDHLVDLLSHLSSRKLTRDLLIFTALSLRVNWRE